MSNEQRHRAIASAQVIVLGNGKGGSGKSTLALHIAMGLMKAGQRVATIDLDGRQQTLTHYIDHRRAWAKCNRIALEIPTHHCVPRAEGVCLDCNESAEFNDFERAIATVEREHDFIVVDTPASDNHLTRLSHCMADTLLTPLNDSFVDLDGLASLDPDSFAIIGERHYAELVNRAREQRRAVDGAALDWVVVRNRASLHRPRNKKTLPDLLVELASCVGFRLAGAIGERALYGALFPRGLTAVDDLDQATLGMRPSLSHVAAREEMTALLDSLRLPLARGRPAVTAGGSRWDRDTHIAGECFAEA